MAPTVAWREEAAPRDDEIRNAILGACQTVAQSADFADFDRMEIWQVLYIKHLVTHWSYLC